VSSDTTGTDTDTDTDTGSDGDVLLGVDGLEAGYETGQVLFGVDLEVGAGDLVSLLGRNGAGKTTTLRCIVGSSEPRITGGRVTFRGTDVLGRPSHQIAKQGLAYVPEDRRCFPALSVAENVQVAINHAASPRSMETVFESFPELRTMRDKHARNLSGGEQQMLAIARALAMNPAMMLLDEPFEGLAPSIVRRIEEIIERINTEEGVTVLFVEQNVGAAMAIADRHYILDEGRIVEEVTTDRLRADDDLRQTYLGI
jgi:branched-chain amino acid transport system ATP-binding protein